MNILTLVVSLQGVSLDANGKLDAFDGHFASVCGAEHVPEYRVCPGVIDSRRGYGITKALVQCMDTIKNVYNHVIIYEDDARLQSTDMCQPDVFLRDAQWNFIILGAHHVDYADNVWHNHKYRRIDHSFGGYAMVIPGNALTVLKHCYQTLLHSGRESINPDVDIHKWFNVYLAYPTIVGHSPGYSSTWNHTGELITDRYPISRHPMWHFFTKGITVERQSLYLP